MGAVYTKTAFFLLSRDNSNLSDFPKSALQIYGIEAQHPDDFIRRQLKSSPELVFMAVRRQRQSLRNPPKTAEELLDTLEHQRLTETVAYLRRFLHLL